MSLTPNIRRRERPMLAPAQSSAPPPNEIEPIESPSQENADYAVGYRRPPLATRFGGARGNRPGRKKGSKSRQTIIREELYAKVDVPGVGKLPKFQVAVRQLVNQAAKGELKAIMALLKIGIEQDREDTAQLERAPEAPFSEHDLSVMELLQLMAREAVAAEASTTAEGGGCA